MIISIVTSPLGTWFAFFDVDPLQVFFIMEVGLVVMLLVTLAMLAWKSIIAARAQTSLDRVAKSLDDVSAKETILRAVAQHANDGLVYLDMEARILWANPAYCRIMGREFEEMQGLRPQEFCFPPELKPSQTEIESFRFDPDRYEAERFVRRLNIRKNGERFWNEISMSLVEPEPGQQRGILVARDVTARVEHEQELERARAELHHAAHNDALTGLRNRTAFLSAADSILRQPDADKRALGLLYVDLDYFKAINDSNGHAAGDKLLIHVADAIRATTEHPHLACRMGGDEFVMAYPGVTDFDTLQYIADALMERIRTPFEWGDTTLICGASIGIALNNGNTTTAEDLIRSADFALYKAKAPGVPSIARYDADLHERQTAENALMDQFVRTLDRDGIDFMFQPILDARSGKIRSFETLARWTHPDGHVIGPDVFLRFAARVNRMTDIDFSAIRATTSLVAELNARGHSIRGAFNVSSDSLAHPDFMECLKYEANKRNLSPDTLVAEVLETTFFGADTTDSLAATRINDLRELGYCVYLDDFGVGYAGLSHLSQLNVSGVKLDRSLIANVAHDRSARIITTSILRLCDELGVGTLGEGIETAEQFEFLSSQGCFRLQGFGIARPMSRSAVIDLVEQAAPIVIPPQPSFIARTA